MHRKDMCLRLIPAKTSQEHTSGVKENAETQTMHDHGGSLKRDRKEQARKSSQELWF